MVNKNFIENIFLKELKLNKMNYTKEQIRIGAEKAFILDLIVNRFPKGIVSYVADSFNLWDVITKILPTIKSEIMARDGKLVIRPDSGDPVDIICGLRDRYSALEANGMKNNILPPQNKGVIELLWDIFGGTVNEQGYKVLDPHIGAIYGDSITPERQVDIYKRLAEKGFASTNIVLGIGSFTYEYMTRDTLGFAAKGAWFEVEGEGKCNCGHTIDCDCVKQYDIYKDPITDDGTKKSLKGFLQVYKDEQGEYRVKEQCTVEEENAGELQLIFENGKFFNQTSLTEIRKKLNEH